jgi:hypothetical protein
MTIHWGYLVAVPVLVAVIAYQVGYRRGRRAPELALAERLRVAGSRFSGEKQ